MEQAAILEKINRDHPSSYDVFLLKYIFSILWLTVIIYKTPKNEPGKPNEPKRNFNTTGEAY